MHLDILTGILTIGNEPIKLTKIEARLLAALIIADGRPISSEDICEYIWPYTGGPDSGINNITCRLWHLRRKLKKWPKVLETRLGIGHSLTIPASMSPPRPARDAPMRLRK